MDAHPVTPASARCRTLADVAERLMAKYESRLSLALIATIVRATARTAGQTASETVPENLLQLADRRLAGLAATPS